MAQLAARPRLHHREEETLIAVAGEGADPLDIGIVLQNVSDGALMLGHGFEGDVLACEGRTLDEAGVLTGDEAGGHGEEQIHRSA